MVLYRSPEQTDLHTMEVSSKFTTLRFLYKLNVQKWHDGPMKWRSNAVYGMQCLIFFIRSSKFP